MGALSVPTSGIARSMSKIAAHTINSPAEVAAIAQSATIHIGAPSSLVAAVSRLNKSSASYLHAREKTHFLASIGPTRAA